MTPCRHAGPIRRQDHSDRQRGACGSFFHPYFERVLKADNEVGYELRVLHLMGRNKQTLRYEVFYGDRAELVRLDQRKPQ